MQDFQLTFTFIGFKERNVILEHPVTGKILWPIKTFPDELQPGDQINIGILSKNYETKQKEIKEALKELL